MKVYDSMMPFEDLSGEDHKAPERPVLQIATPEASPTNSRDSGFDWNLWEKTGWHTQMWPRDDIKSGCGKSVLHCLPTQFSFISALLCITFDWRSSAKVTQTPNQARLNPYLSSRVYPRLLQKISQIYRNVPNVA
jgi:hypothetical protein